MKIKLKQLKKIQFIFRSLLSIYILYEVFINTHWSVGVLLTLLTIRAEIDNKLLYKL